MNVRETSMGPRAGNRPPHAGLRRQTTAARPDCRRAHQVLAFWPCGQEADINVRSVAHDKGRDRQAPGHPPTVRMIRPWRKDEMISAWRMADDRIAGCA